MKFLKIFVGFGLFILLNIVSYEYFTNWSKTVMEDKPRVNYSSAKNIKQSKDQDFWIATFSSEDNKYFTEDRKDSLSIKEVWIEENRNLNKGKNNLEQYDYILNVVFNWVTHKNLHKFKLIQNPTFINYTNTKIGYPDAAQRVRYLLKHPLDTVKIEVIERNPEDSINWMTETVVDTIVLTKVDTEKIKSSINGSKL